ncbi:MAG: hypothetical protein IPG03_07280 [Candidatus Microthrix sp.]|nr:hypothetical protein [Candidatus Microthrix sp.]MBK6502165.1 hypothetical protein [Candidatus Microthrix sp.]
MSELIPYSQQSSEVVPTGVGALVERKADRLARKQVEQLQRTKRVGLARLEVQAQLESAPGSGCRLRRTAGDADGGHGVAVGRTARYGVPVGGVQVAGHC